jgi:hypothetical protein
MTSPSSLARCSIAGSSKALLKALRLPNNLRYVLEMEMTNPWVKNLVDNFGFTLVSTDTMDRKQILINKKKKLVVKVMYSIGSIPKNRAPTKLIANLSKDTGIIRYDLVLQSLVNISHKAVNKAETIIINSKNPDIKYGYDTHSKNYGLYKNKAVVFDW